MVYKLNSIVSLFIIILMLGLVLTLPSACWGGATFKLMVENKSQYDLIIYVNDYKMGRISPDEQIEDSFSIDTGMFKIEAKNIQNGLFFSKTYTFNEMEKIESKVYKVTIK